jgi:hypothetical protein
VRPASVGQKAPATVTAIRCHVGHVSTANAWELADAQGTVGKRSASSLEGRTKAAQATKGKTLSPPPSAGPSGVRRLKVTAGPRWSPACSSSRAQPMSWRVCSTNPPASIDPLVGRFVYGDATDTGDSDNRLTASRRLEVRQTPTRTPPSLVMEPGPKHRP